MEKKFLHLSKNIYIFTKRELLIQHNILVVFFSIKRRMFSIIKNNFI
jgi:hypothetical protein